MLLEHPILMSCNSAVIFISLFCACSAAFAPIQWAKSSGGALTLMPKSFPGHHLRSFAIPQELTVGEAAGSMMPYFTSKPDSTISLGDWCVEAAGRTSGSAVIINSCSGGLAQQWNWIPDGNGRNLIQLRDTGLCLDVDDKAQSSDGAAVELQQCENLASASWMYEAPVPAQSKSAWFVSSMRHVMVTLMALVGVGALSLGAGWWRRRSKATFVAADTPSSAGQEGGVSLAERLDGAVLHPELGMSLRNFSPAIMAVSPIPSTEEGETLIDSYINLSSAPSELADKVSETFDRIGQTEMLEIMNRAQSEEPYKRVVEAFNTERHQRMLKAKERLEDLLATGEIRNLNSRLTSMAKKGELDAGFIIVLNKNIEAATSDKDETKLRVLTHISSVIQEELEKKTAPETGVLHKLMRTDDEGIRGRILEHYLAPQTEILLPNGDKITLDEPKAAVIDPMKFAEAVSNLVNQLRGFPVSPEEKVGMIDDVRKCAIQARATIVQAYPSSVVDEFSDALAPSFQDIREKARENAARSKESQENA